MISDDDLRRIAEGTHSLPVFQIEKMAAELLAYREAERRAKSWDDAPEWAVSRRPCHQSLWRYYDQSNHEDIIEGKIALDTLEEKPK